MEVGKLTGLPSRCLLTQYIRPGYLPYPDDDACWSRERIDTFLAWLRTPEGLQSKSRVPASRRKKATRHLPEPT